jgi:hypothetical protein
MNPYGAYLLAEVTQQERWREAERDARWRDSGATADRRPRVAPRLLRLIGAWRGALVAPRSRRAPRGA